MSTGKSTRRAILRAIPQSEGYLYGSDGSVWSRWGKGYRTPTGPLRRLAASPHKSGHPQVRVKIRGKMTSVSVATMTCWAFHGRRPKGKECRHIDGDPTNGRSSNLRWGTRAENIRDQLIHGVLACGEKVGQAKLTAAKVKIIRRLYAAGGHTYRSLAARFGVNHSSIKLVVTRATWRHIT